MSALLYNISLHHKYCEIVFGVCIWLSCSVDATIYYTRMSCRRHNHKWRLPSPIQDRCIFAKSPCASSDTKISLWEAQSCLGLDIWGQWHVLWSMPFIWLRMFWFSTCWQWIKLQDNINHQILQDSIILKCYFVTHLLVFTWFVFSYSSNVCAQRAIYCNFPDLVIFLIWRCAMQYFFYVSLWITWRWSACLSIILHLKKWTTQNFMLIMSEGLWLLGYVFLQPHNLRLWN